MLPKHLDDYHLFTTVAAERHQPPEHPYRTAGGTDVDLAICNEELMANLCHYVMVHTATSIDLAHQGQPTKKNMDSKRASNDSAPAVMLLLAKNFPNSILYNVSSHGTPAH